MKTAKASIPPPSMLNVQSFDSPNRSLDNITSATILIFPRTVVVVALVREITLLCTQLYKTALTHPSKTKKRADVESELPTATPDKKAEPSSTRLVGNRTEIAEKEVKYVTSTGVSCCCPMRYPLKVIISAFESVAREQKTMPQISLGLIATSPSALAIVIITPVTTQDKPSASAGVGYFVSTNTAQTAQTAGMQARIIWFKGRDKCKSEALFNAMLQERKIPTNISSFQQVEYDFT